MGAMLVGIVTGMFAWIFFIVFTILFALLIFIDARRHNMKSGLWAITALILNFYILPVYIYTRIKIATLKCENCGAKVNQKNFCSQCGSEIRKFNDEAILKKFLKIVLIVVAVILVVGSIYVPLTSLWT